MFPIWSMTAATARTLKITQGR